MPEKQYKHLIKCPHCGYEYLPAEIYIPNSFLGEPEDIVRDEDGHIEFFSGDSLNLTEEYRCDKCGCLFSICGKIDFETNVIETPETEDDTFIVNLK